MPAGRLTLLDTSNTTSAGSSISCVVPNDGSVVAGQDLLIVGAGIASGTRTMSISGGAGGWTDHGRQSFTGHGSELWTKIAQAGDLGATITVTPSTGSIQQVMGLAMVEDVNPTTPLGSPAAVSGTQNSSGSTSHVASPTVAGTASGTREVCFVFDSQVSPQTWTAPGTITEQGEDGSPTAAGGSSMAFGDAASLTSGSIGNRVWTKGTSSAGSAWTLGVLSSGSAVTGDASLAGAGTLTATGSRGRVGSATLAGTVTLTATGAVGYSGGGSLAGVVTLTASGFVGYTGSAVLAGVLSATADGVTGASWVFRPPTVDEGPVTWNDALFIRYKLTRGVSLLEGPPGTFRAARYPTQDEIAASLPRFFQGGYDYLVDDATRTALLAAGVGVTEDDFTPPT